MFRIISIATISFFFLITNLFSQPSKKVLIEEATGTWCAWCPEGKVFSQELLKEYAEELIFIEVHRYDPMTNQEYSDSSRFFSYPSGHVNRKIEHLEPRQWEGGLVTELNETPPANIHVETIYDSVSRKLTVQVSAEFFESLSGDYRLAAIVVEDAVTGDDENYNQKNIFADNAHGFMGGFEILPSSISHDFMVYDHIARHLLGGYNGSPESLPIELEAGNTYSHSFDWILPTDYNEENIWVAALLLNNENGEVINAGKSIYLYGNENAKPFFVSEPLTIAHNNFPYKYNIRYHDSDGHSYKIEILDPIPSWLNFNKGRTGFATLEGIPENVGTHDITLRLTDTEHTVDQSFQIVVKDPIPPVISTLTDDFLILPNPNDGVFILEYNKGVKYQVFDELGKMIANGTLTRDINDKRFSQPINIKGIMAGLYFLKVFDFDDFVKTKKLLIVE